VFGRVSEVHGSGGIVVVVVEFEGDDVAVFATTPTSETPTLIANAVAHDGVAAGLPGRNV
jgi:hypothetical protein